MLETVDRRGVLLVVPPPAIPRPDNIAYAARHRGRDALANKISADDLLTAVAERRDRSAFAALFDHFAPKLKGYLRRQGAGDQEAEDLVQDVMLKVWRRAQQFDATRGNAGTWVFAIARNERISALRRERRPEVDANDPTLVPDAEPPADENIDRAREAQRLHGALKHLPQEQAEVVRMSFIDDKAHGEIAAELGLPLGTVKSRIRLALGRLRQALKTENT